jgi:AraC-like DNA-binding protein
MDWVAIGGQELGTMLAGNASAEETADRIEKRFAPLLPRPPYSGLTAQAIEIIQANLERSMSVEWVAKRLKITPEHFIRVFKEKTRQTPHQYINELKMERAKILLKEGGLTVSEVAYRLGYKTPAHFSRLFSQLVRHNPKEYRK